ncbi:MAG: D-hexose-6-phosphate mutarotase [Epsilonproteobacteria bacterium]|nr:D-hexose-6-phosphate mutarotase [Campylobacterota bacterium]
MDYIKVNNNSASALIALQGAHIFEYIPNHSMNSILWLSDESEFKTGTAIRGGIPICWPWFGLHENKTLPQHGFARTSLFKHIYTKDIDADTTEVLLRLTHSKESLELWDYKFELEMKFSISKELKMELRTKNIDSKPFKITQALHSYFAISDIRDISIIGLDKQKYFDALTKETYIQDGDITFDSELDRVYQNKNKDIVLIDEEYIVDIGTKGSASTVIWNPWIDKSKRMSGMSDEAYKEFVCIENANAMDDFKIIKPNSSHTLEVTIIQ